MKRRILLPTDFSDNAQNAIDYAINLYANDTCDFYILNTYYIEEFSMELAAVRDLEAFEQKSISGLSLIFKKLLNAENSKQHQYHMVSECGALIDIMKDIIEKHDIDIVIMGTKGDTDSRSQIYGSQTVLAMERIRNCPVLAIPKQANFKGIQNIIFPTGYNTPYKRREFDCLIDIANKTGAAIRVLNVLDESKELNQNQLKNQNLLKDYFEELDCSFHVLHDTELLSAINSYILKQNIDMVAFINKRHNFFSWIISKPMVKNLTYHTTIPILALHDLKNK
ncbi:universal stress protein [Flaviramulus aquimarinus]|uniref:Universal stress protein n=1 Tax=Flaviramulus aquimarinus TaxID=1170456 RepID=A0ABP9FFR2_9FLAO